jgi:hypothetical protein
MGKIVVVADLHVHPWRLQSRDGGHDRLRDGLGVLQQSLDLARAEGAVWVFAGDMKQPKTSWPQSALTGVHETLRAYGDVRKIMVAGNHDAEGIGGSGLAPFRDCAIVVESTTAVWADEHASVSLLCVPWNGRLEHVLAAQEVRRARKLPPQVLVAHGFLAGCGLGTEDTRIAKGAAVADYGDFPVAFFGDVHKGQWRRPADPKAGKPAEWFPYSSVVGSVGRVLVREAGPWRGEAYYAGSPYAQNWGEREDPPKGALLVDLETGEVWLVPLKSPGYSHLELDEAGLRTFVETSVRQSYAGRFVRVVYAGKPCAALDEAQKMGDTGEFRSFQLVVRRPLLSTTRVELHAGMAMPDLLRRYVDARPPADLDAGKTLEALTRLVAEPS